MNRRKFVNGKMLKCAAMLALAVCLLPWMPGVVDSKTSPLKSKRFVLEEPAKPWILEKPLHNGTVLQSFAIDNVNKHVYLVQLMSGGQQLPGEPEPKTHAERDRDGDLALTKLDEEGNLLGHMFLKGFGHGVQIGVEPVGETAYLWTETDAVTEGKSGWGSQLARFAFEDGKILTSDSPELQKHRLIEGADRTTVHIDQAKNLLTMRYRKDGAFRFGVFPLEEVKRGSYSAIADVKQPSVGTFQGFASYGGFLYLLEGNSYGSGGSTAPTGNTFITAVNLVTGEVADRQLILAGSDLTFREPEGMSIRIPNMEEPHKAELAFGFATSFTPQRLASIFTIDRMLPDQAQ